MIRNRWLFLLVLMALVLTACTPLQNDGLAVVTPVPGRTPWPDSLAYEETLFLVDNVYLPGDYEADVGELTLTDVYSQAHDPFIDQDVELLFDLYQPADDSRTDRPLIILTRFLRDTSTFPEMATLLADRGFVAVVLDVRHSKRPEMAWQSLQASAADLLAAVRYFRANAADYGINPERIVMGGVSYGAETTGMAIYLPPDEWDNDNFNHPNVSNEVFAVIMNSGGLINPDGFEDFPPDTMTTLDQVRRYIAPDAAPLLLFHGGYDDIIEPENSINLYKVFGEKGIPVELYLYYARHGGFGMAPVDIANRITLFYISLDSY